MLRRDLLALGIGTVEIDALPGCPFVLRPKRIGEALGCAYVLEGATLGGRQIGGELEKSDIPEGARNFFASYGELTGQRWSKFCAMLEKQDAQASEEAVPFASGTFEALAEWLEVKL